ncbi:hypothetical protein [Aeromonas salmonicida]|uniref:hypothetical protein n=1 Tax=Aeromonas salmonicida TaxID=645 RepID=UPI003D31D71B
MGKLLGLALSHIKNPIVKWILIGGIGAAGAVGIASGVVSPDDVIAIITAAVSAG